MLQSSLTLTAVKNKSRNSKRAADAVIGFIAETPP
jgi:hypothetical protein